MRTVISIVIIFSILAIGNNRRSPPYLVNVLSAQELLLAPIHLHLTIENFYPNNGGLFKSLTTPCLNQEAYLPKVSQTRHV